MTKEETWKRKLERGLRLRGEPKGEEEGVYECGCTCACVHVCECVHVGARVHM